MLGLVIFFFQAEDGIRDYKVTGVQTCALPIWRRWRSGGGGGSRGREDGVHRRSHRRGREQNQRHQGGSRSHQPGGERSQGQIGRASGRGRGEISVVAGSLKKKKETRRRAWSYQ